MLLAWTKLCHAMQQQQIQQWQQLQEGILDSGVRSKPCTNPPAEILWRWEEWERKACPLLVTQWTNKHLHGIVQHDFVLCLRGDHTSNIAEKVRDDSTADAWKCGCLAWKTLPVIQLMLSFQLEWLCDQPLGNQMQRHHA